MCGVKLCACIVEMCMQLSMEYTAHTVQVQYWHTAHTFLATPLSSSHTPMIQNLPTTQLQKCPNLIHPKPSTAPAPVSGKPFTQHDLGSCHHGRLAAKDGATDGVIESCGDDSKTD